MIGTTQHLKISSDYTALFDAFYRVFPKPEYFGKIISYRHPDYAYALLEARPAEGDRVLDVGCACSYFVNCLARFAEAVYGVDLIDSYAKRWSVPWLDTMDDFEDYRSGKIEIVVGNAATLPFPDDFFDKVYTFSALEHFLGEDDSLCAAEVGRVLKPGGVFIGSVDFNEATEKPWGQDCGDRVYTHEAFLRRIVEPSGLALAGSDHLAGKTPAESVEYVAVALFFKLVKL